MEYECINCAYQKILEGVYTRVWDHKVLSNPLWGIWYDKVWLSYFDYSDLYLSYMSVSLWCIIDWWNMTKIQKNGKKGFYLSCKNTNYIFEILHSR